MSDITNADVRAAAAECDNAQGYPSPSDLHKAIYDQIIKAVAKTPKDRIRVAITQSALMSHTYPQVDPPDVLDELDPNYELDKAVYWYLHKRVWRTTHPFTGRMQSLLADHDRMVICRLGGVDGHSAYVTKNAQCYKTDVIESQGAKDLHHTMQVAQHYGRVSTRIPTMAKVIADAYDTNLVQQLAVARAQVPMLATKYSDDIEAEEEPQDES